MELGFCGGQGQGQKISTRRHGVTEQERGKTKKGKEFGNKQDDFKPIF